jgi:hypothetical protein
MVVTPLTATWGLLVAVSLSPVPLTLSVSGDQGAPNGRWTRPQPLLAAVAVSAARPITGQLCYL